MKDLIEALQILLKYMKNPDCEWPTNCTHDDFTVVGIDFTKMTVEDVKKLDKLGFLMGCDDDYREEMPCPDNKSTDDEWKALIDYAIDNDFDCMHSFRFGSC